MEKFNAVLKQKIEVAPGLCIFRIAPLGWKLPEFKPGQYCPLGLLPEAKRVVFSMDEAKTPVSDKLIKRPYSIASSSVDDEYLEFYIKMVPNGSLTPRLFALENGDKLWMRERVFGMFTLDDIPADRHVLFFATGTGLAPYMSMLRTDLIADGHRKWAVVHGALNSWDLGYRSELTTMQKFCKDFCYLPVISEPADEVLPWTGQVGFLDSIWKNKVIDKKWGLEITPENTTVFFCGHPMMVKNMVALLEKDGFTSHSKKHPGSIIKENFA